MGVCFANGCRQHTQDRYLMCRTHWFQVPEELRDEVWKHYKSGDRRKWSRAALAARKSLTNRQEV